MTDTLENVAADNHEVDQQQLAEQLLAQAKEQGVELVGPNGLLNQLTKKVLETALEEEMADHLGYDKHDPVDRNLGNSRNGIRAKTVLTEVGPVEIDVPRDVDASFTPQIVKRRQRRLTGVDEIVLSLTARGLTTGEIWAHFAEVYGASVSRETVSKITDKVVEVMTAWANRAPGAGAVSSGGADWPRRRLQCPDMHRTRCHPRSSVATANSSGQDAQGRQRPDKSVCR